MGLIPCISSWLLEARRRVAHQLEDRLGGPGAEHRVQRDPGRGQQPDPRRAQDAAIAAQVQALRSAAPVVRRVVRFRRVVQLGHAPAVDEERQDVDTGIDHEADAADGVEDWPGGDDAEANAQQRGGLEARDRAAADRLVAGGRQRDVAQDRRDGGRGRGALQQARAANDPQVDRDGGDQDRHHSEDRADLHDPVRAEAIRQVPEGRGEHQLGQEVGGGQDADGGAGDLHAAVFGQRVEVVDQQATGQARAEAQREGAEQDRRDRSVHGRDAAWPLRRRCRRPKRRPRNSASSSRMAPPATPARGRGRRRPRHPAQQPLGRLPGRPAQGPRIRTRRALGQLRLRIGAEQADRLDQRGLTVQLRRGRRRLGQGVTFGIGLGRRRRQTAIALERRAQGVGWRQLQVGRGRLDLVAVRQDLVASSSASRASSNCHAPRSARIDSGSSQSSAAATVSA